MSPRLGHTQLAAAIFLVGLFAVLCRPSALAQSVETVRRYETEPHIGAAEDALVGVIVTNRAVDGTVQVRHGCGVFIRCDGFIMAPESLFNLANTPQSKVGKPDQSVTVVLNPGTDHEKRMTAQRPRDSGVVSVGDRYLKLSYNVFKLNDVHHLAPRLLDPGALSPGDSLRLIYSDWIDGKYQQVKSAEGAVGPKPAASLLPGTGAGNAGAALFAAQTTRFLKPVVGVPNGAIVVGPDSLVVGIVTDAADGSAADFANVGAMDQVTDAVGVLPSTDKQFQQFIEGLNADANAQALLPGGDVKSPLRAHSDMVTVTGGPLKVPSVLQSYDPEMENVYDACIPSFQIDRFEVTNAQYLEFWKSLPEAVRKDIHQRVLLYPYGWGGDSMPFPQELANVAVLGVRLTGAQAYAKWVGKRLPTPYEWCLAAFGRYGGNRPPEWAAKYLKARADTWDRIVEAHLQYLRQHLEIVPGFTITPGITGSANIEPDWSRPVAEEVLELPWFFMRPGYSQAAAWSHDCVRQLSAQLFKDWVDPGYVLAAGSRPYDVSACGAQDMIMNARELVLPGPHGMWKKPPNDRWPYRDIDRYMEVDWVQAGLFKQNWFRTAETSYDLGIPRSSENPVFVGGGEALVSIDRYLGTTPMFNTDVLISHPAHNEPGNIAAIITTPGLPLTDSGFPLTSIDAAIPPEGDSRVLGLYHPVSSYEFRMPSRRLFSASQNAQGGVSGIFPADLGDYVKACSGVQEYSEVLRPVDTCMLNLVPGPTFEVPYWTSTGTWGYGSTFQISQLGQARRVGRFVLRGASISDIGMNEWTADATCIGMTGAFSSWAGGPDHYHQEIGRALAVDTKFPVNSRGNIQAGQADFVPDTFLIPGGFRCAR